MIKAGPALEHVIAPRGRHDSGGEQDGHHEQKSFEQLHSSNQKRGALVFRRRGGQILSKARARCARAHFTFCFGKPGGRVYFSHACRASTACDSLTWGG